MNRITLLICACIVIFFSACKKDDNSTPYSTTISGVLLRNVDAAPAGTIGTPDTKASSDSFTMALYPTPCVNEMHVYLETKYKGQLTLTARLVNVIFPGAPAGTVIENEDLAGIAASSMQVNVISHHLVFNVADLPQGFYRVYIELSNGETYWDNGWVSR